MERLVEMKIAEFNVLSMIDCYYIAINLHKL